MNVIYSLSNTVLSFLRYCIIGCFDPQSHEIILHALIVLLLACIYGINMWAEFWWQIFGSHITLAFQTQFVSYLLHCHISLITWHASGRINVGGYYLELINSESLGYHDFACQ